MYTYNISKSADNKIFKDTCKKIEEYNVKFSSEKPLIDVDGSIIQTYYDDVKKVEVYNDYEIDAVYVNSDFNLDDLFKID
jgi:pentose-5-phosphate-3-epimerase